MPDLGLVAGVGAEEPVERDVRWAVVAVKVGVVQEMEVVTATRPLRSKTHQLNTTYNMYKKIVHALPFIEPGIAYGGIYALSFCCQRRIISAAVFVFKNQIRILMSVFF